MIHFNIIPIYTYALQTVSYLQHFRLKYYILISYDFPIKKNETGGALARMKVTRNTYKIFIGKPEEKSSYERFRLTCEDNIKKLCRAVD